MPYKLPFRVVHVSGQDENFKAKELNAHGPLTKGWQSSRFCLYPQDIVIQLNYRSRLRKIQILAHQHLIPTMIEFFIGDVPDGIKPRLDNTKYNRLGYVALSDNEKTGYKARELKSVHVDAQGVFLKIKVHKNYINKYNLYNQVGLIAINVIGDSIEPKPIDIMDPDFLILGDKNENEMKDPIVDGYINNDLVDYYESQPLQHDFVFLPDYISPLDDLAFDMYQDPEIAQIIRKLERKKQEAVLQERYDYAKKLKLAITDLQKVGEKLGKMEIEKRQAVENEDYDKAKVKKVHMDEIRLQFYKELQIHDLLELSGTRHPVHIDLEPVRQPTPPRLNDDLYITHNTPPVTPPRYEDRPLPSLVNRQKDKEASFVENNSSSVAPPSSFVKPAVTPYEDRPLPVNQHKNTNVDDDRPLNVTQQRRNTLVEENRPLNITQRKDTFIDTEPAPPVTEDEDEILDPVPLDDDDYDDTIGEAEPMTEKDLRDASQPIEVFGEPLVSKAYSKTWSYREDALLAVYKRMTELPSSTPKDEARYMMKAAVFLVKRAIDDKVYAVFKAAIHLLRMILTEFVSRFKIPKQDVTSAVERTLPNLLHKAGDTAVRNRDDAKSFILEAANFPDVKPTHIVPHELVKPFKMSIAPRIGQSHGEIVESLYKDHGIKNSGFTVENLMPFCCEVLNHHSADVRTPAERIIKMLYRDVGAPVKEYLPPDDERTRKITLWRQLFEYFDKVDGKPSKEESKRAQQSKEAEKQAEIEGLQKQLQQLRDMQSGKEPVDENILKDAKTKKNIPKDKKKTTGNNKSKSKAPPVKTPPPEEDDASQFNIDNVCIFCDERNPAFTEEGLDVHYWKNCPLLKRCNHCRQVVEIASYTDHLLNDCADKQHSFKKCPRCTEAILKKDYDSHVAAKACVAAKSNSTHCPLCHTNVGAGDEAWKKHLMGKDGCKENPRRHLLFTKQPQAQTKIPKKTTVTKPLESSVIADELVRRAALVDSLSASYTSINTDITSLENDVKQQRQQGVDETQIRRKVTILMEKKTERKSSKKKLKTAYRNLDDMVTDSGDWFQTTQYKEAQRALRQAKHLVTVF